jgi:hypothetical protein
MMMFLTQLKFLPIKISHRIKKNLIVQLLIFFPIFSISHCYAAVAVGDSYGGGTVFCVSQTPDTTKCVTKGSGDCGLIMANEDQVNYDSNPKHGVSWSSKHYKTGTRSDDDGAANTAIIIAALPEDNSSNNAAWLCHNYRDQEGHTDWYLPSKNELNKMHIYAKAHNLIGKDCSGSNHGGVQCLVGGGGSHNDNTYYWSSSVDSSGGNGVWCLCIINVLSQSDDNEIGGYMGHLMGVRAIRAFNNIDKIKLAEAKEKIKNQIREIEALNAALTETKQEATKYKDELTTTDKTAEDKIKMLEAANKIVEDKVKTLEETLVELKQQSNDEIKALEKEIKTLNTGISQS